MSAQDDGDGCGDGDGIDEVAAFAALLTELKERTDRSYGSLARRLGMNTSTLHRYCAGDAVPLDFAPAERFAALCGATPAERLELHRRWLLAVAARHRPKASGGTTQGDTAAGAGEAAAGRTPQEAAAAEAHAVAAGGTIQGRGELRDKPPPGRGPESTPAATAAEAVDDPDTSAPEAVHDVPPPRPWHRRRRLIAGLAAACAVLASLGAFSLLPDGRRVSADGPDRVAGAPERRGAAPGPSGAPTSGRPSDADTPKRKKPPKKKSPAKKPDTARPPGATSTPPPGENPTTPPLTWTADSHAWKLGCGHDYVVARPPSQVPPPPAPQDAVPWAATQKAVHGGETLVRLSVQGRSETAVVLEELRVRVVGRTAPVKGNAYRMDLGCGGAVTPRTFAVDLDKDRPIARAVPGNDTGTPIPAVRMPYRVSAKDPEVLLVNAGTRSCDCRWYLELDWSSQGRKGTVRVDDDGRPFRTSAIKGLPRYGYDTIGRRWGTYN
ncbi:helix-turn-helix domain-containing protein [Streptomyces venezuelae]|uniref:helix-turn-helix domain-containing protein n=1 Tax=Streptomyces venezuelae TaxID=54571 RepID=UPI0016808FA1|nr:helix-turn-helix transcriptional regulator [Streptomyces venezuelae]